MCSWPVLSQDRRVPWWDCQRGAERGPCLPLLLCAWCLASRPFTEMSFFILCAYSCFISQCLLELRVALGTWGGNHFPTSAPGLFASSPLMAICNMYLLTSLIVSVLSLNSRVYWVVLSLNLRPECLIRSPCLALAWARDTPQLYGRTGKRNALEVSSSVLHLRGKLLSPIKKEIKGFYFVTWNTNNSMLLGKL